MAKDKKNDSLNLHQKLIELRKEIPYLQKNASGFNFKYAKGSVLLGLLRPKMDELGILLSFDIEELHTEDVVRMVKKVQVNTARVKIKYVFTWTDARNPSDCISKTIWTQGIGDTIQDMGGYNTYMLRYFLMGFLNIPSDNEDPDNFTTEKEKATPCEVHPDYRFQKQLDFLRRYGMDKQRTRYHEFFDYLEEQHGNSFDELFQRAVENESDFLEEFKKWEQEQAQAN